MTINEFKKLKINELIQIKNNIYIITNILYYCIDHNKITLTTKTEYLNNSNNPLYYIGIFLKEVNKYKFHNIIINNDIDEETKKIIKNTYKI